MQAVTIKFGENQFDDEVTKKASEDGKLYCLMENTVDVAILDSATVSGKPAIFFRFITPDGHVIIQAITAANFMMVASALKGRYPELFKNWAV